MAFTPEQESYHEGYWEAAEQRAAASAQQENIANAMIASLERVQEINARQFAALQAVKSVAAEYLNAYHRPASWAQDLFAKIVCIVEEGYGR